MEPIFKYMILVCALSDFRENEKEEVWTCYISPQYIFCITELENGDAFLYQRDIKSKKQEKTLICNDPRCIGMMGDWLYFKGYDDNHNYVFYRVNIKNQKKEIAKYSQDAYDAVSICKDKIIMRKSNDDNEDETIFLDLGNLEWE